MKWVMGDDEGVRRGGEGRGKAADPRDGLLRSSPGAAGGVLPKNGSEGKERVRKDAS